MTINHVPSASNSCETIMQTLSSSSSCDSSKEVRFANPQMAQFHPIQNLSDLTDQEWSTRWYTSCEYQQIREDIKYAVNRAMLREASPIGHSHNNTLQVDCLCGLESRMPEGYRQRQQYSTRKLYRGLCFVTKPFTGNMDDDCSIPIISRGCTIRMFRIVKERSFS
jgi:hypothetical protein